MHFLLEFFKGVAIGAGAILPGISSGVLCVIFGIYETLLNCTLNFFKNFKYNFKILFPIALGVFLGIVLFGNILKYVFCAFPLQTQSVFIGLIIGSIPELLKKAKSKSHSSSTIILNSETDTNNNNVTSSSFMFKNLIYLFISFCVGVLLVYIEKKYNISNDNTHFSFFYLMFSGFVMSAGVIIPGVSSTLILMILGVYDAYLLSVSTLYIPFLLPLATGLLLGCICCMKVLRLLLDKFYSQTFFSIIGFTIGSIFVLFPIIYSINDAVLSLLCIFLGIFIVFLK